MGDKIASLFFNGVEISRIEKREGKPVYLYGDLGDSGLNIISKEKLTKTLKCLKEVYYNSNKESRKEYDMFYSTLINTK